MRLRRVGWTLGVVLLSACRQRQVDVRTAPAPAQQTRVAVQVSNNLAQAVNVYVVANGSDTLLGQVAANASVTLAVPGIAAGTTVGLKAVTMDNARTYQRQNVVLTGTPVFTLP